MTEGRRQMTEGRGQRTEKRAFDKKTSDKYFVFGKVDGQDFAVIFNDKLKLAVVCARPQLRIKH